MDDATFEGLRGKARALGLTGADHEIVADAAWIGGERIAPDNPLAKAVIFLAERVFDLERQLASARRAQPGARECINCDYIGAPDPHSRSNACPSCGRCMRCGESGRYCECED